MTTERVDRATRLSGDEVRRRAAEERERWERSEVADVIARQPERSADFRSESGIPLRRVYTPADVDTTWEDLGLPGQHPFTRGPYPTMYRARHWTMRQIAGYGTPADTNERFKFLLGRGQTGLSVDFDMPTLMGYDSDDEMSAGEVGREGVAIDVLDDMAALFEGIDLEATSVSMTINPTAWILLAMYVALAESRGNDLHKLSGTIQNDILKEYIAQKEWIYPIRPSLRIVRDTITFSAKNLRRYNPINISGYHISEAGANAVQEVAFTLANAITYVELVTRAGVAVDDFAPRLSFYFIAQRDLFEEVAKFRAARRLWARIVKDRFGAQRPESGRIRFHCQTAAATLTKAQPYNNVVRTALQALAGVLGGAQSLHTNGLDEAYAIPTESAMELALRTQQILAEETGVANVVDPLGGSWYVEALTDEIERRVQAYLERIEAMGGMVQAIERSFPQREIADNAYQLAQREASGAHVVVGVNRYVGDHEAARIETHRVSLEVERRKIDELRALKARRDGALVGRRLSELVAVARDEAADLMPATIAAVKARASLGEIANALREPFDSYRETAVF